MDQEIAQNIHQYLLQTGETDAPEDFNQFYETLSSNDSVRKATFDYMSGREDIEDLPDYDTFSGAFLRVEGPTATPAEPVKTDVTPLTPDLGAVETYKAIQNAQKPEEVDSSNLDGRTYDPSVEMLKNAPVANPNPVPNITDPSLKGMFDQGDGDMVELYSRESIMQDSIPVTKEGVQNIVNITADSMYGKPLEELGEKQVLDVINKVKSQYATSDERERFLEMNNMTDEEGFASGVKSFGSKVTSGFADPFIKGGARLARPARLAKENAIIRQDYSSLISKVADPETKKLLREAMQEEFKQKAIEIDEEFKQKKENLQTGLKEMLPAERIQDLDSFWMDLVPSGIGSTTGLAVMGAGTPLGTAAAGALTNAEDTYQEATDKGVTDENRTKATLYGAAIGASEGVLGNQIGRMSKLMTGAKPLKGLKSIGVNASEEFVQEGLAAVLNNINAKDFYDESRVIFDKDVLREAAVGAVVGGGFAVPPAIKGGIKAFKDEANRRLTDEEIDETERFWLNKSLKEIDVFEEEVNEIEELKKEDIPQKKKPEPFKKREKDESETRSEEEPELEAGDPGLSEQQQSGSLRDVQEGEAGNSPNEGVRLDEQERPEGEEVSGESDGRTEKSVEFREDIEDTGGEKITFETPFTSKKGKKGISKHKPYNSVGDMVSDLGIIDEDNVLDPLMDAKSVKLKEVRLAEEGSRFDSSADVEIDGVPFTLKIAEHTKKPKIDESTKGTVQKLDGKPDGEKSGVRDSGPVGVENEGEVSEGDTEGDVDKTSEVSSESDPWTKIESTEPTFVSKNAGNMKIERDEDGNIVRAAHIGKRGNIIAKLEKQDGQWVAIGKDGNAIPPGARGFSKRAQDIIKFDLKDQESRGQQPDNVDDIKGALEEFDMKVEGGSLIIPNEDLTGNNLPKTKAALDGFIERSEGKNNLSEEEVSAIKKARQSLETNELGKLSQSDAKPEEDTNVEEEAETEPSAEEQAYGSSIRELTRPRIGMSEDAAKAMADAIKTGKITPESEAAYNSRPGKKGMEKANTLIRDYHKARKGEVKSNREKRGKWANTVSADLNRTDGEGKKILEKSRDSFQVEKNKYKSGKKSILSKFKVAAKKLPEGATEAEVIGLYDSMIKGLPKISKAIKDTRDYLASTEMFTDEVASLNGYEDVDAMIDAAAASMVLGERSSNKQGKLKGEVSNSKKDFKVVHPAIEIYNKEKKMKSDIKGAVEAAYQASIDNQAKEEDFLLADEAAYAAAQDLAMDEFGNPIFDSFDQGPRNGRPAGQYDQIATQTFLAGVARTLSNKFPGITILFNDQAEFDRVAGVLGKDPDTRGFYYDGTAYINPRTATQNTPMHELSHVWLLMARNQYPSIMRVLEKEVQATSQYAESVNANPDEDSDYHMMEALADILGDHATGQYIKKSKRSKLQIAIDRMWNAIKRFFGIKPKVRIEKLNLNKFINLAGRELMSDTEISLIRDLNMPEFADLNINSFDVLTPNQRKIQEAIYNQEDFAIPAYTWLDKTINLFQDRRDYANKVIRALSTTGNVKDDFILMPGKTKYQIDQMTHTLFGDLEALTKTQKERTFNESLMGRLADSGIQFKDFTNYLYALHAPERNQRVRDIKSEEEARMLEEGKSVPADFMVEDGSGMTDAEAQVIVDRVAATGKQDAYDAFAREVQDMSSRIREMAHESGLISDESLEALENFEWYIPLKVEEKGGKKLPASFSQGEITVKTAGIKRLKGTGKYPYHKRVNPLAGLVMDYRSMVIKSEKNRINNKLAEIIEQNPNDIWEVHTPQFIPVTNSFGNIVNMNEIGKPDIKEGGVINFLEDGKVKQIIIRDQNLYNSLNMDSQTDHPIVEKALNAIRWIQGIRRALIITFNFPFSIANFAKDVQTGLIMIDYLMGDNEVFKAAGNKRKMLKYVAQSFDVSNRAGAWMPQVLSGKLDPQDNEVAAAYEEMISHGGQISWSDPDRERDEFNKITKRVDKRIRGIQNGSRGSNRFVQAGKDFFNGIALWNASVEQVIRLAAYRTARDAGKSPEQAAKISKEITINFNKKGTGTRYLNTLYMFSNAGIQGTTNILKATAKSGAVRRDLAGLALTAFMVNWINDMIGGEEEEDEMDFISNNERRFQMHFHVPGTKSNLKMPMAYGPNMFKVLGDQAYLIGQGKTSLPEAAMEMMQTSGNTLSPFSGGADSPVSLVIPDVLRPFQEVYTNKNFAGIPIQPDERFGMKKRPSQNYFKNVSEVNKGLANVLSEATGGRDNIHGDIEISPEVLDYSVAYALGGVGTMAMNAVGTGKDIASGEEVNWNKVPIVRRFFEDMEAADFRKINYFYDTYSKGNSKTFNEAQTDRMQRAYRFVLENTKGEKAKGEVRKKYKDWRKSQKDRKSR